MASENYSIQCEKRVALVHIRGSWSESTTRRFVRDFKQQITPLLCGNWAQIVFFDDWQFSSPDNEQAITDLLNWSIVNGLTHSARIFKADPLKSYQLNRMMHENDYSMNIRHFHCEKEGGEWLAKHGFQVNPSLLTV
ncbi:hypothetical protein [uncultured Alteromonas sp.]|jgi:hypothetical protein|uniref:hypothetical protein n=1 Tax=uncultured Alteromonas sp. TaxID=179113 RepID=UPI0025F6CEA9|nr:hypothetical protein [uncultured Alteromonas sp.]